jgi:hypothetical protein
MQSVASFVGDILTCSSLLDSQKLHPSSKSLNLSALVYLTKAFQSYYSFIICSSKPFIFIYIYTDVLHLFTFYPTALHLFSHYEICNDGLINSDIYTVNSHPQSPLWIEWEIFWNENTQNADSSHPFSSSFKPDAKRICF